MIRNRCLLLFTKTDTFWGRFLSGYTHVVLGIFDNYGQILTIEPLTRKAFFSYPADLLSLVDYEVLEIRLRPRKKILFGPRLQTCATVVQYLAGISLGALRVQKLYDLLTKKSPAWLKHNGILEVKQWDLLTTPFTTQ